MTKKQIDPKATAHEVYQIRKRQVQDLYNELGRLLQDHVENEKKDPKNWGNAGDLAFVYEQLRVATGFLKGEDLDEPMADY